jgi:glycosyltransferase involved in cell wall biosynthesis
MNVTFILPSRGERFLAETIADIYKNATGDFEVIAVLDGYWPDPILEDRHNLSIIHFGKSKGLRAANNAAAALAKGKYLCKLDAHCMVSQGIDEILAKDCADNEIIIPRRYSLDAENWTIKKDRPKVDYHYLSSPVYDGNDNFSMHGQHWRERDRERIAFDIDDNPSFQGSCWFMSKHHYLNHLGGMYETGYGTFSQEPQELGNKTWLGPWSGRVAVNKKAWYAHLHKGKQYGRGYFMSGKEIATGHIYSGEYWMFNKWQDRAHDFEWMLDKFPNMPTWTSNWREKLEEYRISTQSVQSEI